MEKDKLLQTLKQISDSYFQKKDYISSGIINRAMDVVNNYDGVLPQADVSGSYMAERTIKILEQPEPLEQPPYNCPSTGDKRVGDGCSYPNCMCEWHL